MPDTTIIITDQRVSNLLALLQMYGAPLGVRHIDTVTYPGGSYVNDTIVFTSGTVTKTIQTNLAVIAPGSVEQTLFNVGLLNPLLNPASFNIDTIFPGINDFNVTPAPTVPVVLASSVPLVGALIVSGNGLMSTRHYANASPFDHFGNGALYQQDGVWYKKVITETPFGDEVEWDQVPNPS